MKRKLSVRLQGRYEAVEACHQQDNIKKARLQTKRRAGPAGHDMQRLHLHPWQTACRDTHAVCAATRLLQPCHCADWLPSLQPTQASLQAVHPYAPRSKAVQVLSTIRQLTNLTKEECITCLTFAESAYTHPVEIPLCQKVMFDIWKRSWRMRTMHPSSG